MITPTKGIAPQRALLTVGAQIVQVLSEQPVTVSQAWAKLKVWRERTDHLAPVPFGWFVLALDGLFTLGVVSLDGELLAVRRADASASSVER